MPDLPKPTESELAILRALWRKHPATVREVMETLNEERDPPLAYTTVLKFFQIMTDKGLVIRDDADRTHSYSPAVPPDTTKKQMVGDLLDRLFQGSVSELVLQALGNSKLSKAEAAEIKKLLDQQTRGKS
ncbi:MAG: BlaI/MecI/CopY family transcriptional regulator [Verrucomicrobiaceae bacterium]|nr:BlaI/MecI/CopY family transcriptional regulator [Verrucomicrobiaceae bacterium]